MYCLHNEILNLKFSESLFFGYFILVQFTENHQMLFLKPVQLLALKQDGGYSHGVRRRFFGMLPERYFALVSGAQ